MGRVILRSPFPYDGVNRVASVAGSRLESAGQAVTEAWLYTLSLVQSAQTTKSCIRGLHGNLGAL
jgi:hypothetical protein